MDQSNIIGNMSTIFKLNQFDLMKKFVQILLPISLFSLLFSQPSTLDELSHIFHSYASTVSIKFFDYNPRRNYAFLVFNGLIALIVKSSGLIRDSPWNSSSLKMANPAHQRAADGGGDPSQQRTEAVIRKDGEENGVANIMIVDECDAIVPDAAEEDEDVYQIPTAEYQEEEEEDEDGKQSVEELNRKCDAFIRKMREGIKMDIQGFR